MMCVVIAIVLCLREIYFYSVFLLPLNSNSCLSLIRQNGIFYLPIKPEFDSESVCDMSCLLHACNAFITRLYCVCVSLSFSVYSLSRLFSVDAELSVVARQGSGSACRSMYGGFVQWKMGERKDGKDSVAEQVAPETHWPELRVLVLVVSHSGSFRSGLSFGFL